MVEQQLALSLDRARALILAGEVFLGHERVDSGARQVASDSIVTVRGVDRFVSRGGFKLEHALATFEIPVEGRICADVGAATGGFSDAMLQRGAARVYAVDVGYGDLHWKVRSDARSVPIERTNARYLESLPEPVSLIAVDVSFISVTLLLDNLVRWFSGSGDLVVLVKPQFEAGQKEVSEGEGIVTDPEVHRRVLTEALDAAEKRSLRVRGLIRSPIQGMHGNIEFLLWLDNRAGEGQGDPVDLIAAVLR